MLDLKSRLSRSYLHSTPNPSFDKGGACCKPTVCHLRCGDAGDSVDCMYSGLVVYAARLKWQGLIVNPRFATARYLMHSLQKSRGARFSAICKKENNRSKSDCSFEEVATYSQSILVIPLTYVSLTALCNRG